MAGPKQKMHPGFLRNAKVLAVIAALAMAGLVIVVLAAKHRSDKPSEVDVPNVDASGGTPAPETPHYSQALAKQNAQGATQARAQEATFIPALSDNTPTENTLQQREAQTPVTQKIDYSRPADNQSAQQLPPLPAPAQGLGTQMSGLFAAWDNPPNSQKVLGLQQDKSNVATATPAAGAQSAAGASSVTSTAEVREERVLIPALTQYAGHLMNGIDTDAPSDVFATIDEGPCKNGELAGAGRLSTETVTVAFTTMRCNGKSYNVAATALNDETLMSSLPADIDHRYGERILAPALLGAVGAVGSVYANSGATVSVNPLGGTTSVNPNATITQAAGAAAAGGTQGMTQVVSQQVNSIPPIRGRVAANTTIIVKFKADVAGE
jgi:intracellular multiplication protein IcmE